MKYLSLFTGIGGFELGIQQAYENLSKTDGTQQRGISLDSPNHQQSPLATEQPTCIGFSEIDKYAVQIYQKHFPTHTNYGDITKINAEELPDFDFLCGGFPCQAFSIAGKRRGFEDTRGTLFFDIARIAKAKKPMLMLLENVKGLVSHDGGKTLETILESLQELGYYVNMEIRNSKDYGVPQNRERIFILCKHIKLLSSVGLSERMTTSEQIIEEWLFQVLLNNLKEAQKLQGTESKDWVLGYLLCQEIKQNPSLSGENILDGILTDTGGRLFQSKVNPWQNIDTWLQQNLGENLKEVNKSTILTAIKQITESETYTFSQMFQTILLATVLLRKSSKSLWNEILSNLIVVKEDTKYARINNKNEKAIITENGTAHLSKELQDPTKYFIVGHLRGTRRPEVFPFGGTDKKDTRVIGQDVAYTIDANYAKGTNTLAKSRRSIVQVNKPKHSNDRVYGADGISPTLNTMQGGRRQPFIQNPKMLNFKKDYENSVAITVTAYKEPPVVSGIRRLTPLECERLQGFPDNWTQVGIEYPIDEYYKDEHKILKREVKISDTQRYKMCGNAVSVPVIKAIVEKIYGI